MYVFCFSRNKFLSLNLGQLFNLSTIYENEYYPEKVLIILIKIIKTLNKSK